MFTVAIVCYLFLGGAGAGAALFLAALGLLVPNSALRPVGMEHPPFYGSRSRAMLGMRGQHAVAPIAIPRPYRDLFAGAYAAALVVLLLGIVLLAGDLGRFDRVFLLVTRPAVSYIAFGSYALVCSALLVLALALAWGGVIRLHSLVVLRTLEILTVFSSLCTMTYTGLFLQSMGAVPLWNTLWLPVLFVLSSASCGIALVSLVGAARGMTRVFTSTFNRLVELDALVALFEALAAFLVLRSVSCGIPWDAVAGLQAPAGWAVPLGSEGAIAQLDATRQAAALSVGRLLMGDFAWLFWGGFVLGGVVCPVVFAAVNRMRMCGERAPMPLVTMALCTAVLIAGFIMRYCVMFAAVRPALPGV